MARRRAAVATTRGSSRHGADGDTYLAMRADRPLPDERGAGLPARLAGKARHDFGRQRPDDGAVSPSALGPYPFAGYTAVVTDGRLEIPVERRACRSSGAQPRRRAATLSNGWSRTAQSRTVVGNSRPWPGERHLAARGLRRYAEWIWLGEPRAGRARAELADTLASDRLSAMTQDSHASR
ncbi:hypothetical protein [Nonomuraea dietziae]|uniref:hypothetical protein n=1 Tax=Nonomuraea dietziae TaxID=65515 RepID=UPI0031E09610